MDTNLKKDKISKKDKTFKKGKLIRAFIYRVLCMGSLFVFLISAVIGRNALYMAATIGPEKAFSGKFYVYPEFQEFIDTQFYNIMLYYAGIDDANLTVLEHRRSFFLEMARASGDILYYIETPKETRDNTSYPLFSERDGQLLIPGGYRLCYYWNGPVNALYYYADSLDQTYCRDSLTDTLITSILPTKISPPYETTFQDAHAIRVLLAVKTNVETYTHPILKELHYEAKCNQTILWMCIISLACTLFFGLLCLFSQKAGRMACTSYANLSGKVLFEIKLLCLTILGFCFYRYGGALLSFGTALPKQTLPSIALFFPTGCLFYLTYTDYRQNGKKILTQSLIKKLILYVRKYIHSLPWYRKALTICAALMTGSVFCILVGIYMLTLNLLALSYSVNGRLRHNELELIWYILGGLLLAAGLFLFIMYIRAKHFIKDMKAVTDKISSMLAGTDTEALMLPHSSLLCQTAAELNVLESGIEAAVEQKNRSNKMRVELITNVSHDLKTPLTSIINYADLLCEEDLSPAASEYAKSLQKKAYRLKAMVQDVFELSKATSGNLPVKSHTLDLARLLKQTLADMEEQIQNSPLTFKVTVPDIPVWVDADGDRLYRVFQNLFINTLQYSLENSRVHVTLSLENNTACVKVKNTSKQELNFDTQEIVERFVRADSSRTSEGSGLGLSIAESFTEACGGTFHIETDADMFTACVQFPSAAKAPTPDIALKTTASTNTADTELSSVDSAPKADSSQ